MVFLLLEFIINVYLRIASNINVPQLVDWGGARLKGDH